VVAPAIGLSSDLDVKACMRIIEMCVGVVLAAIVAALLDAALGVVPPILPFPIIALLGASILPIAAGVATWYLATRRATSKLILTAYFVAVMALLFVGGIVTAQLGGGLEF
jgi:hypothetical protein